MDDARCGVSRRDNRSLAALNYATLPRVTTDAVFIHGAGQAGADAWPNQLAEQHAGWHFLPREGMADNASNDARRVIERLRATGGGHVVAHSYGANAALLAAQAEPDLVRSLALLEPACFDLARGRPGVEEHIAAMTPVFQRASDPGTTTREFSLLFAQGMGFEPPDLDDDELEERVRRLRALRPPWDLGLSHELKSPSLVITGGERQIYEETAQELARLGARHQTMLGATHRIQDDPRANATLREWFSEQR